VIEHQGIPQRGQRVAVPRWTGVLVLLVAALTACGSSGSEPDLNALCRSVDGVSGTAELVGAYAGTTSEVAALAAREGVDARPWSDLPADHFLVHCSFNDPAVAETAPTTICPNGDSVALKGISEFVVDKDGRTTTDPTALLIGRQIGPCGRAP
jgi:hypothetical protein